MENRLKKGRAVSLGFDDPKASAEFGEKQLQQAKRNLDECEGYLLISIHDGNPKVMSCTHKGDSSKKHNIVYMIQGFFSWIHLLVKGGGQIVLLVIMHEMDKIIHPE